MPVGLCGGSRDRTGTAEFGVCGFGTDPFGVVTEHDEELRRGVGSNAKAVSQCWGGLGGEVVEHGVVGADLGVEVQPAAC